ncbi:MAG TPA: hypothetical protein PLU50_12480, partial [Pseudobdellovibrionaceae bacterium]|nr:hypothetical protein [Pseudobdellovibrionaceae bacterium]
MSQPTVETNQNSSSQKQKIPFVQMLLDRFGEIDQVIQFLRQETQKNPIDARLDLQVFLNAVGREEESFQVSQELIQLAPSDPRVCFNRGWHLIHRGLLRDGMRLLEHGRIINNFGNGTIGSN